jgi:signal transduction histidine kinase
MSSLSRFLALSLLLLLILLTAAFGAQAWLRQQEKRLESAARHRLELQLRTAVELTGQGDAAWGAERITTLTRLVGSQVRQIETPPASEPGEATRPAIQVAPGVWLIADLPQAPTQRLLFLFQRVLLALGVLALVLLIALIGAVAMRRSQDLSGTRTPFGTQQRDTLSLARLAQTSVAQQQELHRERDERLRAEEEARARLQLLNRALEEKIHIGRDLHDGVIQSLYAAGLTLQSVQPIASRDPEEASRRIETTLAMINRTITEIRSYIGELSPLAVRGNSITRALEDVVNELRATRAVECDLRFDEAAAAHLTDDQISDTLQITREAVSNALRHGEPKRLRVHLLDRDGEVVLEVEDDGRGFSAANTRQGGHGLANMRARAERSGGHLEIESLPARGTRLQLHWPGSTIA